MRRPELLTNRPGYLIWEVVSPTHKDPARRAVCREGNAKTAGVRRDRIARQGARLQAGNANREVLQGKKTAKLGACRKKSARKDQRSRIPLSNSTCPERELQGLAQIFTK
jgi:hypothetical protein